MNAQVEKRYFKVTQMSQYLSVAEQTLRNWAHQKKIPSCKINGGLRFDVAAIDEWIKNSNLTRSVK